MIPKRLIMDRAGKTLYLTRWWLIGQSESRWALMLHKMHRPDDDSCHHDHPWSFFTLVLWGGYVEEVTLPDGRGVKTRHNRPGMLLYRPAEHTHRIAALPKGYCYTLVLRLTKRRHWGFHTQCRGCGGWGYIQHDPTREPCSDCGGTGSTWVPWQPFIQLRNAVQWCDGWVRKRV